MYQNKFSQNKLTQSHKNFLNQPIHFMNNQMLNNNPIHVSNIYDQQFYQQMMLQREDQMRKIRTISDLGMTRDEVTEYVIAPLIIQRSDKHELEKLREDEVNKLTKDYIQDNWWKYRTNAPYKNILKNEDWKKDFNSKDDLIVH